jgi:hypothetical protein
MKKMGIYKSYEMKNEGEMDMKMAMTSDCGKKMNG